MIKLSVNRPFLSVSLLLCLFVLTTCSPHKDIPYQLPNPILAAFTHQIDIEPLRDTLAKDTLKEVKEIDGGFVLYSDQISNFPHQFQLWINDSLLITRLESMPYTPLYNNGVAGKVLLEAGFRSTYSELIVEWKRLFSSNLAFSNRSNEEEPFQYGEYDNYLIPFTIDEKLISPIDTLNWRSNAFGNQGTYSFKNGILHGAFHCIDKTGLKQLGTFQNGSEYGVWEYRDSLGKLQYQEEYAYGGELQKVVYKRDATYERSTPLPTLKELKNIHIFMLMIMSLAGIYILYLYSKVLRNIEIPYKGQTVWEIFFGVLFSPILSVFGGMVLFVLVTLLSSIFPPIFNWDLPNDPLAFIDALFIFIPIECLILLISNRFRDIHWHILIMVLGTLIYFDCMFLGRLGDYFG